MCSSSSHVYIIPIVLKIVKGINPLSIDVEFTAGRRKNLGYLWAIQHGATKVYETDDDNELKSDDLPSLLSSEYYVYNVSGEKPSDEVESHPFWDSMHRII